MQPQSLLKGFFNATTEFVLGFLMQPQFVVGFFNATTEFVVVFFLTQPQSLLKGFLMQPQSLL